MYARSGIEQAPLQVYVAAALFAPSRTVLREVGGKTTLVSYVKQSPPTQERWSALLLTLEGHSGAVWAVQFSPNGSKLASASRDEKVMVWNPSTGEHLHTLEGHLGAVNAVQFSPDGSKLASASHDKKVMVWDLNTNSQVQTIDVGGYLSDLAFSPDGVYLKTDIGSFKLDSVVGESYDENAYFFHLRVRDDWIYWHGYRMIWLPPALRASGYTSSVLGSSVALGHSSGTISFWEIRA
jgi:WD40 repeat protein